MDFLRLFGLSSRFFRLSAPEGPRTVFRGFWALALETRPPKPERSQFQRMILSFFSPPRCLSLIWFFSLLLSVHFFFFFHISLSLSFSPPSSSSSSSFPLSLFIHPYLSFSVCVCPSLSLSLSLCLCLSLSFSLYLCFCLSSGPSSHEF